MTVYRAAERAGWTSVSGAAPSNGWAVGRCEGSCVFASASGATAALGRNRRVRSCEAAILGLALPYVSHYARYLDT